MKLIVQGKYQGHKASIYDLIILDQNHFLSAGGDGYVVKWNIIGDDFNGQVIASVDAKVFSMCMIKDGLLTLGDMNGHLYWVDTWKKKTVKNIKHHSKGVYSILYHNSCLYT